MGSIIITDSILEIRSIYIYNDRNFWFFMGEEGYDQFCISKERIKDQVDLIPNQLRCDVIFWKDRPISIRLPKFVTLKVIHTVDKKEFGDRCVGEWKSVILQTGAIIKVPYFIRVGDTIKINTKERTYESRCRVRS
ncbi:hypothetical protein [Candidatus Riesia pediculischaeffi]|uniref:Elongation factor P C-terminal domain-containing protein n=2 Tax=Candidatus Riesia pediculischaeffi TaxID=428411 RepID=A0A1V0HKF4_9ENTR|nr:hypothetical protein [Candidatus Riesia pediculischaeffi]ARC53305.1 hypothetical protein AOQ87_01260 [Candidatus Riesia pediculischaeffi]